MSSENSLVLTDTGGTLQNQMAVATENPPLIRPDFLTESLVRIRQREEEKNLIEQCRCLCVVLLEKFGIQNNTARDIIYNNLWTLLASNGLLAQHLGYFSRRKKLIWTIYISANASIVFTAAFFCPLVACFPISGFVFLSLFPAWFRYNIPKIKKFLERQPPADNTRLCLPER